MSEQALIEVPWWYGTAATTFSMSVSLLVSGVLMFYPQALIGHSGQWSHSALTLLLWGIAAGFVHGVGYVPVKRANRWLLGPAAAWLLIPLGSVLLRGA